MAVMTHERGSLLLHRIVYSGNLGVVNAKSIKQMQPRKLAELQALAAKLETSVVKKVIT